ncbi:hypothetical protein ACJMK2_026132 [Sinanodonta woodiana]|uniref:Uncharacterized protein n=1 Tax=Sinanodonta woodiana TaxID=1069815 RepID=A0ABD3XIN2_SINWO
MARCLFYCCIIVILVDEITGQGNCGSWGISSSSAVTTYLGSETGRAYISTYQVFCTGTVSAWGFYARAYGTIYLQIWRYNGTTSYYTLIGQNQITITAGTSYQEQDTIIPVPPDMRISAKSSDYIGWMTSDSEMITFGTGSNVYYISASPAIGSTLSFTSSASRMYAVKAYMDNSE